MVPVCSDTSCSLPIPRTRSAHRQEECAIKTLAIEQLMEDEVCTMESEFVWLLFGHVLSTCSCGNRKRRVASSAAPAEAKVREMLQELEDCSFLSPPHVLEHSLHGRVKGWIKQGYIWRTEVSAHWTILSCTTWGSLTIEGIRNGKP